MLATERLHRHLRKQLHRGDLRLTCAWLLQSRPKQEPIWNLAHYIVRIHRDNFIKTAVFLVVQIAQTNAATPAATTVLILLGKFQTHSPKSSNLTGVLDRQKAQFKTLHRYLARGQVKNKWSILSSQSQKLHFKSLPLQASTLYVSAHLSLKYFYVLLTT
jgi:hypothetical protein